MSTRITLTYSGARIKDERGMPAIHVASAIRGMAELAPVVDYSRINPPRTRPDPRRMASPASRPLQARSKAAKRMWPC